MGKSGRGAIVVVEHADEDVDEIDADVDAVALLRGFVGVGSVVVIFVYGLGRGLVRRERRRRSCIGI